jgi:hypothetical protein
MVMLASDTFFGSATAVALNVAVPALAGAVYLPVLSTVPPAAGVTDQVTPLLLVPVTVTENCCVPPDTTLATDGFTGEIATNSTATAASVNGAAAAPFGVLATAVALTLYTPAAVGDVYNPVCVIVPPVALQTTCVLGTFNADLN